MPPPSTPKPPPPKLKVLKALKPLKQPVPLTIVGADKAEGKEWTKEEIASAIGWKQGVVVFAMKSPYSSKRDARSFALKDVPPGLRMVSLPKGKGSASKSFIPLKGKPPAREVHVDIGIIDAFFSRRGLRFQGDPQQRTTGDFSIKNLSTRRGRVFTTKLKGGNVLSRKPIKGIRL